MFFVVVVVIVIVMGVREFIIIMAASQAQPTLREVAAAPAVQTESSVLTLLLPSTCGTGRLKTAV